MNTSRFAARGLSPGRFLIGLVVASCLAGCSQGGGAQRDAERQTQGTAAELDPQSCISEALGCTGNASTQSELAGCRRSLQSCLADTMTRAGLPAFPTIDASFPEFPDAGFPPFPDAGLPPLPDAGLPPVSVTYAAVTKCVEWLLSCLSGETRPAACTSQVETCLANAF